MAGVPLIQGNISYDFREAINALARSTADAAMLASRWYDLCDTETPKDVTVNLSSGESMTVPNLAKAIEALKRREGKIDASHITVHGPSAGVDIKTQGVDVGTTLGVKYADGTLRSQHNYATPFNAYYDMAYVSNSPVFHDSIEFLNIPRFLWFTVDSSLNHLNTHAIAIKPLAATASLVVNRADKKGVCLCTRFTLINGDPARTAAFLFANNTAGDQVVSSVTLAPGQHADFLVWCWRGADVCNIMQI